MADPILENFVDGRYADTVEGRTASLIDPSTGEVFAEAPLSGEADVDAAVQAAARAFEAWRDTTRSERSLALLRVADAVEARADALVAAEEPEHGQAAPADPVGGDRAMPHGGFKHSGYGKDLSMYGFEDYTRVKHVMSNIEG